MEMEATERWQNERVELRLLRPGDVTDAYIGWLNDPEINRFLESRFQHQDRASVAAFVEAMLASDRNLLLAIVDQADGRHVGNIKLGPIDRPHGLADIGIIVGERTAWGRGFGTAAIQCVVEIARHELGLRKLSAGCYASNRGSARAFEKAGFHVEAVRRDHLSLDGRFEDHILLSLFLT
jgi:RimJ/RimL family protein N-acetyltransferase